MNVLLKIKAEKGETFEPLWGLLNESNIPYRIVKYKFGSKVDIEISEEEVSEVINLLANAPKYQLLSQHFA